MYVCIGDDSGNDGVVMMEVNKVMIENGKVMIGVI